MPNKIFKLSMVAAALMAANSASAAIYQIVPVDSNVDANKVYSSAISDPESPVASEDNPLGCFATDCGTGDAYLLGGDTRQGEDGISYRDEVPFKMDNTFTYQDLRDIRNYCYSQLGYSTCETWAEKQWFGATSDNDEEACDYSLTGGLCQERRAFYQGYNGSNATVFVEGAAINPPSDSTDAPSSEPISNSINAVLNKLSEDGTPIGIASSGYYSVNGNYVLPYRQRGFYGDAVLLPKQDGDAIVKQMGRTFAYDSFVYDEQTYVVGSASVAPFDYNDDDRKSYYGSVKNCMKTDDPVLLADCQNFAFATKAYVWTTDGSGVTVAPWSNFTAPNHDDYAAQGSARTATVPDEGDYSGKPVLGGFNTVDHDDNYLMQAAIFYPKSSFTSPTAADQWDTVFVSGAEAKQGDDYIYSNSLIKDINKNLIAIGEAKRQGDKPENGAANNRLFYTDASEGSTSSAPKAVFLSGDIFFKGAGGEANAINNYNEMVGSIDAEDNREVDGKQRRRRGFIDPLNLTGTDSTRLNNIFQGKAWYLDNLTNDGDQAGVNNQYRIVNATGINDDGVISATANYCVGGYDNTTHNSYCGDGNIDEKLVAVKLVPIAGATAADIETRGEGDAPVERQGAGSLCYFMLTMLGLISFRRRKMKM